MGFLEFVGILGFGGVCGASKVGFRGLEGF